MGHQLLHTPQDSRTPGSAIITRHADKVSLLIKTHTAAEPGTARLAASICAVFPVQGEAVLELNCLSAALQEQVHVILFPSCLFFSQFQQRQD